MRNIDIDITAQAEDTYEDVFGLDDIEDETSETSSDDLNKNRVVRRAKEGVNSIRLSSNDSDILEFMKDKGSFSKYVKKLIRAEIDKASSLENESIAELKELNDKMNQILSILEGGTQIVAQNTDSNATSQTEVFDNPDAHKFSTQALGAIQGILGEQLSKNN